MDVPQLQNLFTLVEHRWIKYNYGYDKISQS